MSKALLEPRMIENTCEVSMTYNRKARSALETGHQLVSCVDNRKSWDVGMATDP